MRRIFTALAIFTVASSLLALAEAKKPIKVAVLKTTTSAQSNESPVKTSEKPPKKHVAKEYLPMPHYGGY
jgi:hypothetical protein